MKVYLVSNADDNPCKWDLAFATRELAEALVAELLGWPPGKRTCSDVKELEVGTEVPKVHYGDNYDWPDE